MDIKRRARERAIAAEIAGEIHRVMGPTMPEALVGENRDIVCGVFADAFDRHGIVTEASGARILGYVPKVLAGLNQSFADLNRKLDAAVRPILRKPDPREPDQQHRPGGGFGDGRGRKRKAISAEVRGAARSG
jgi:hypothetical protein